MTKPNIPKGNRFFARAEQFIVACPSCGTVNGRWRDSKNKQLFAKSFDPRTASYKCPGCAKRYLVGLIFYPVKLQLRKGMPPDTIPNPREALAMRELANGIWAEKAIPWQNPVNHVINVDCTCFVPCEQHPEDFLVRKQKRGKVSPLFVSKEPIDPREEIEEQAEDESPEDSSEDSGDE